MIQLLHRYRVLSLCALCFVMGCAEMRNARLPMVGHQRTTRPPAGAVEKVTTPEGVQREVVRLQQPQLASLRSPQRAASLQIVERGKGHLSRREYDKALQAFQEAATVDGTNGIAYYYLAKARYELRQPVEAMGLLERAESLLGDSAEWLDNVTQLRAMIQETVR